MHFWGMRGEGCRVRKRSDHFLLKPISFFREDMLSAERQKAGLGLCNCSFRCYILIAPVLVDIPQRSSSSLAGAVSPHGHGHMR